MKNGIAHSYADQIDLAEAHFRKHIETRHFFEAMSQDYTRLNDLYERAAREESAAIAAAIERGQFIPLLSRRGPETCRNPVSEASGSEKPRPYDVASNRQYYPVESKRIGESGIAHVYVQVSEAGCVTEAIMASSTGYARLDAAGLDFMIHARFKPAEIDGHAVASGSLSAVAFDLTSER